MKKGLLIGCGSVLGLFLLMGACVAVIGGDLDDTDTAAEAPKEEDQGEGKEEEPKNEEAKDESGVTLENFEKIENGMSYDEVVEMVGAEGELMSEAGEGEFKMETYTWKVEGGFGANMTVSFQDGKVTSKAQVGLE